MIAGHPALRLLARCKLRGMLRKQKRRFRTPSGIVFGLLGLLLFGFYVFSLVAGQAFRDDGAVVGDGAVSMGALVLTVLTLANALAHRGLYLPPEEIEVLFSAPLSRPDVVRYRLLVSTAKSALGATFIGLIVMQRMPQPWLAFVGVFLAVQMLPVVGQATSILAGRAEQGLFDRIPKALLTLTSMFAVLFLVFVTMTFMLGGRLGRIMERLPIQTSPAELVEHPAVYALSLPMRPWVAMITAESVPGFLFWFALCALVWIGAFELTARLPVDFRELSLQTSSDVARRINRMRRGGGAASSRASKRTLGWRMPWIWGRSPFGAVAWRKSVGILRKARGTLFVSAAILLVLSMALGSMGPDDPEQAGLLQVASLSVFGVVYLGAGLRFDFRDDLEQMESIKAWPLRPTVAFLATITPQAILVSALILLVLAIRAVVTRDFEPMVLAALPGIPVLALVWGAVDNAVFLFSPVRYVPGQDGAIQNMGRALVLMLVRFVVILLIVGTVGLSAALPYLFDLEGPAALSIAILLGSLAMGGNLALLITFGGSMFRRFDVARDRG